MELKEKFKLKKIIKELKSKQGKHTELISVYIPQGYDLSNVLNQLAEEKGTASNIKSKTTRKNVMDALEKTIQHLKLFKNTPVNGLAVFCGNVSEREGVQDLKLWSVEPFEPINIRIYRCDQKFVTEPLEALVTPKDVYGLIAIDNKEATIATLKGDHYNILKKLTSGYHGKHRAGGQSQRRFERVIRQESHEFKVRVAEYAENSFLPIIKELKGIIIGGPAGTKDDFFEGDYLHHELKKKIIAVKDITYTNESGIRELIDKSQDILKGVEMVRHKTLMQRFMKELVSDGNFSYGDDVYKALEMGAVEILLLSENLDDETIDKLYEFAKSTNARVEIVSDDFE
ncbi:MAG TPA: peptide chain release factor 1, partial [Candidatus Altiarchaeales archaeon]|nr:peptide chain release factor 1 [Candidatus Altiarchaeales archaeon]